MNEEDILVSYDVTALFTNVLLSETINILGPVARSLVIANRWLRGTKTYRLPWYLTLVSANHVDKAFTNAWFNQTYDLAYLAP